MPGSTIVRGQARRTIIKNAALSVVGSDGVVFGVYDAGQYSRLTGLFSIAGSGMFRVQFGADSGGFQVSSALAISSGGSVADLVNYGNHVRLSFSQLASQTGAVVLVLGEPLR